MRVMLLTLALAGTAAAESRLVAVLPLDGAHAQLDAGTAALLDESLRASVADALSPLGYTVLTGETTLTVLQDNGVDVTHACEASCSLDAARELRAAVFVSGAVARSGTRLVLFARMTDVGSARQLGSVQVDEADA